MELMLHRRLLVDDHWGVGEALNETAFGKGLVARGKHYILFDFNAEEAFRKTRLLANELYAQPLITFDVNDEDNKRIKKETFLSSTTNYNDADEKEIIVLPPNVNLLTVEPIISPQQNEKIFTTTTNLFLVRFEHLFDVDEHSDLSLSIKIPFRAFLEGYFNSEIKNIRETTLGGDRFKEDAKSFQRFNWNSKKNDDEECDNPISGASDEISIPMDADFDEIELQAMEIRTFLVELM